MKDSKLIKLAQDLIKFKSITDYCDDAIIDFLIKQLQSIGFQCFKLSFGKVTNLYAKYGKFGKNFCFAGHVDVVSPGDISLWKHDPFLGVIEEGNIYGRGAVDMKSSIAAFVNAVETLLKEKVFDNGIISFIITGDEEGIAVDGTVKVLEWLNEREEKIDFCLVGEPTSSEYLGDIIKIGRRGSLNLDLKIKGIQGHCAYHEKADNPITKLAEIISILKKNKLDYGNSLFEPSNLEFSNIVVDNNSRNVIPSSVSANFNIRFNNLHNSESLYLKLHEIIGLITKDYELKIYSKNEPFINDDFEFAEVIKKIIKNQTGKECRFGTEGGTSDARFIIKYCPVVEFGLLNFSAHKTDENCSLKDLVLLSNIYKAILYEYFNL